MTTLVSNHVKRCFKLPDFQAAQEVLMAVEQRGIRLKQFDLGVLTGSIRGFRFGNVNFLVNGVTKWKLLLDWYLTKCLPGRPVSSMDLRELTFLRLMTFLTKVHREGTELLYESRRPQGWSLPSKIFLESFQSLLATVDIDSFAEILDSREYLSVKYSHPMWMIKRWAIRYDNEKLIGLLATNNSQDPLVIRSNGVPLSLIRNRLTKEDVSFSEANFHEQCLILRRTPGGVNSLRAFRDALFQVQAEMPAFVGNLVSPRNGDRILDMCSAPGGKLSHIATLIDAGEIDAVDSDCNRLSDVESTIERLRTIRPNVKIRAICADGTLFDGDGKLYDRIVIDAPCSGLGVLSRHADARWHREEREIFNNAEVQEKLLNNCARLLRKGGSIVYSTCTIEPEENENQVSAFLMRHPDFRLVPPGHDIPRELLSECGLFYNPRKYARASFDKIQNGFAAVFVRE